jgi:hypothetical protein
MFIVKCHEGTETPGAETDSDSGKSLTISYDSVSSVASNGTTVCSSGIGTGSSTPWENIEELEVRKQQKDIWENGIDMWVFYWLVDMW